jgi:hypothetical protein
MFGFKAYFRDEQVFIDGHAYRSNEILTSYLNFPSDKLNAYLSKLRELKQKAQLMEGGDLDFCEQYDSHVQRAQKLFYQIGNIAKKLPPYDSLGVGSTLDAPLLCDCLNANFYWESGYDPDKYEGQQYNDEDFCNEYGFVTGGETGNYGFYTQSFVPHVEDLESDDPDIVLMLHQTNEAVCKLFDAFITLVQDIIRVKVAYTELLDKNIHSNRKFLTDTETAKSYAWYLKATEKKSNLERVCASGSMQMSYEVFHLEDGKEKVCEAYNFENLGSFLYVDFFRGLNHYYLPKRCDNCGQYFLLPAGKYSNYCERPLLDDPDKTCRDIGARKRYDDKCKTEPIWLVYNRAYKAHYARYMKKKMTTAQFEQWSRYAVELREQAERDELPQAEYVRLMKI